MKVKYAAFVLLLSFMAGSCAPVIVSRMPVPKKREEKGELSLYALDIPNGHMPPPGSCRIWYPGRPAGQQPPPFKCGVGRLRIPLGSFLVQRLDGKMVQVDEYDQKRPDFVVRTGKFSLTD